MKEYKNQENSSFKFFDTSHIRNADKLSKEDMKWLGKSSFSVFTPFSLLARGQWDLLLVVVILPALLAPLSYLAMLAILVISTIFSIQHLRRLAWNRGFYKTLEEYKKSESKWDSWGVVFLILNIIMVIGQFLK